MWSGEDLLDTDRNVGFTYFIAILETGELREKI